MDGQRSLPRAPVVDRQESEVTGVRTSKAGESEFKGNSNSAAKFGSESESMSSFRCFFPDMGKRGRGRECSVNEKGEIR